MAPKVKGKKAATAAPAVRRGRTTTSRLSSKNQITLPVEVIRKAGFEVGDSLKLSFHGGKVIIEKDVSTSQLKLREFAGSMTGTYADYDFESERHDAWGD